MFFFTKNQSIDEYVVVFPHKESNYAQTYRVKDESGNVKFLKLIFLEKVKPFQYDRDGQIIEIKIARQIQHSNLCQYISDGVLEYNGYRMAYIVTDYVKGETLKEHSARVNNLSLQEVRQIMSAILSSLDHIHSLERPIVHNEVSMENILLDVVGNYNNLKLIDFGTARYIDLPPDADCWHRQNLYYVASERFLGECTIVSDIFSAGVILYQLLFGMMPWTINLEGLTLQQQVSGIIEKRNSPLVIPNLQILEMDQDLIKVMVKALTPDPSQRFSTAKEFLDALQGKIPIESVSLSMTRINQSESSVKLSPKKGNGFDDVAGMTEIKNIMRKKIINILKDPQKAQKFKIQIPNGMLLYGPPGCGKTFIAEKFAEEAGYNYMFVKSSDLASIYVHGSQEKIGKLFDDARKQAPAIINFDEFEALVPNRSQINNSSESGEVNEFLTQMNNCGKDKIFIIASSNRPDLIDPAVRRKGRLDQLIYVSLPDREARKGIFKIHMKERPIQGEINFSLLADKTENYVASDIAYIVNDAAIRAFEDDMPITQALLEQVISENTPSVSNDDIKFYDNIRQKLEASDKVNQPSIGFKQHR